MTVTVGVDAAAGTHPGRGGGLVGFGGLAEGAERALDLHAHRGRRIASGSAQRADGAAIVESTERGRCCRAHGGVRVAECALEMRPVRGVSGVAHGERGLDANAEIVAVAQRADHDVAILCADLERTDDADEGERHGEGAHEPRPSAWVPSMRRRH